jgi:hypothetical protein
MEKRRNILYRCKKCEAEYVVEFVVEISDREYAVEIKKPVLGESASKCPVCGANEPEEMDADYKGPADADG